jgi:hypothetical protein
MVLTVNAHFDSLADCGRNAVGGDTQVGAHIETTDAAEFKNLSFPLRHCENEKDI